MPITNRSGFHISFPELPLRNAAGHGAATTRTTSPGCGRFDRYVDDNIELMREGIKQGMTLPGVVLADVDKALAPHIVDDPDAQPALQAVRQVPGRRSPTPIARRLTADGTTAIAESVVPGYRKLLDVHDATNTCRRAGEQSRRVGAAAGPRVLSLSRAAASPRSTSIRSRSTTRAWPKCGGSRPRWKRSSSEPASRETFTAFVEFLRTDPQFYVDTPEQLLKEVSLVLKRMDGELPKLFKDAAAHAVRNSRDSRLHRPAHHHGLLHAARRATARRAGFYYVNTYNLKSRPLFEIEALSLHEAVPGHHMQIALQQELEGLPPFRRFADVTAFVEGWGLYAERLGLEVGFYQDPYRDFGRLSYEMWRACRLVVDTGMHYLGWTRQQAIQFMADNTALSLHNITAEVDRYISWPGQATAYKMGELKIRELRRLAEERLGRRFDVREFHDAVLAGGARSAGRARGQRHGIHRSQCDREMTAPACISRSRYTLSYPLIPAKKLEYRVDGRSSSSGRRIPTRSGLQRSGVGT